jgi:hypothetical protein
LSPRFPPVQFSSLARALLEARTWQETE